MADGYIRFKVEDKYSDGMNKYLYYLNHDPEVHEHINDIIGKAINANFVPMKSGELRASMHAYPHEVRWGEAKATTYARYQFYGKVYEPNIPIYTGSKKEGTYRVIGWYSPAGQDKYPTNRELGAFTGELDKYPGWTFGYTTPGTHHHWHTYYKGAIKAKTNLMLTKYLKDLWEKSK